MISTDLKATSETLSPFPNLPRGERIQGTDPLDLDTEDRSKARQDKYDRRGLSHKQRASDTATVTPLAVRNWYYNGPRYAHPCIYPDATDTPQQGASNTVKAPRRRG